MRVAVIIAAYRARIDWLEQCLFSIRKSAARAGVEADIRIGVDGCEQTADAAWALGQHYHWSPVNVGPYILRNSLFSVGYADAFVVFDADDVMGEMYLWSMKESLKTHNIAGAARMECDANLTWIKEAPYKHGVCAFRPDVLTKLGGYKAERLAADVDFIARAEQAHIPIRRIPTPLYYRRQHPDSLTNAPETRKGSSARERARRRMERERMSTRDRVYVSPVTTPLEYRPVEVTA